jgi:beta-lactamase class D
VTIQQKTLEKGNLDPSDSEFELNVRTKKQKIKRRDRVSSEVQSWKKNTLKISAEENEMFLEGPGNPQLPFFKRQNQRAFAYIKPRKFERVTMTTP